MLPADIIYIIIQYSGISFYTLAKWLEPLSLPFSEVQHLLKLYHDYKLKRTVLKYCVQYSIENKLCRIGGPAKIWNIGGSEYWYNGNKHRSDGPACQYKCNNISTTEWYMNGVMHNPTGPAKVVLKNNKEEIHEWYINGVMHNTTGPARVCKIGNKEVREYWQNGMKHRLDGPAIERSDNTTSREYWINGRYLSKDEFMRYPPIKCCVIV